MGGTERKPYKTLPPYNTCISTLNTIIIPIKILAKTCSMGPEIAKNKRNMLVNFPASVPMVWHHKNVHMHNGILVWFYDHVPNQCTPNIHTIPESVDRGLSTGTTHVNVRDAQPRDTDIYRPEKVRIAGLRIAYIHMGGTSRKPSVHRFWNGIYAGALVGNLVKKSEQTFQVLTFCPTHSICKF